LFSDEDGATVENAQEILVLVEGDVLAGVGVNPQLFELVVLLEVAVRSTGSKTEFLFLEPIGSHGSQLMSPLFFRVSINS